MMAEIPYIAPRNMATAMQAVVATHAQISQSIKDQAAEQEALRKANAERMSAEAKIGYRSTT